MNYTMFNEDKSMLEEYSQINPKQFNVRVQVKNFEAVETDTLVDHFLSVDCIGLCKCYYLIESVGKRLLVYRF